MKKIPVGILGATGMVGQKYISLLQNHPWFEIAFLAASEKSAGKTYLEAVEKRWLQHQPIPEKIGKMPVYPIDAIDQAKASCSLVFSAVESDIAKVYEEKYAEAGLVVSSNASTHRFTEDVPLLIPEINASHLDIIPHQQKKRGWKKGFIVVKPNCSIQSYMIPLFALRTKTKIKSLYVTTLQAVSGAGHPGVSSFDIFDNIIPFISGEEEKSEKEPLKIFGHIQDDKIHHDSKLNITAHCNRVPVTDGHLACCSVELESPISVEEIKALWNNFSSLPQELNLPSAPLKPIHLVEEINRPQPRLDRDRDKGMAVTVGRVRSCNLTHLKFVGLHHNTLRGAAGGGLLNAELLVAKGLVS